MCLSSGLLVGAFYIHVSAVGWGCVNNSTVLILELCYMRGATFCVLGGVYVPGPGMSGRNSYQILSWVTKGVTCVLGVFNCSCGLLF